MSTPSFFRPRRSTRKRNRGPLARNPRRSLVETLEDRRLLAADSPGAIPSTDGVHSPIPATAAAATARRLTRPFEH